MNINITNMHKALVNTVSFPNVEQFDAQPSVT